MQHNGNAVASVLNATPDAITGDLTPKTTARHFISYEWFKYVIRLVCWHLQSNAPMLSVAQRTPLNMCSTLTCQRYTPVQSPWSLPDSIVPIACRAVLQAVVLLFALGVIAAGQFHRFRIAICCLLAVTTVLFCDACQTFYYCKRFYQRHCVL